MSADAKVFPDDEKSDGGFLWRGIHDGCDREHGPLNLSALLAEVEGCDGAELRWEIRRYDNGAGLADSRDE